MGDVRYQRPYRRLVEAADRAAVLRSLSDADVIAALAASRAEEEPYLANVLASEAMNRMRRQSVILENAVEGLLSQDAEGRLTFMNPAAERMLGWTFEEARGRDLHELVHAHRADGSTYPRAACPIVNIAFTGEPVRDHETTLTRRDGSTFPARQNGAPVLRDGEVESVVVTFTDITETRRAQAAQRQLAAIVEASEDSIVLFTQEGTILAWNRGAERIYGYTAVEMIGGPIAVLAADEGQLQHQRDIIAEATRGGSLVNIETRRIRKDGVIIDVAATVTPIRDATGRIAAIASISRDITEKKRAEIARAYLAAIVSSAQDAILAKTLDGIITAWSPGAQRLYGYRAEEIVGRSVETLVPPDRPDEISSILERVRRGIRVESYETKRVRKDGVVIDVSLTVSPVSDSRGELVGASAIARDITPLKRYERLFDATPIISLMIDDDGRTIRVNAYGARQLGYTADELVGRPMIELFHPEDRVAVDAHIREAFSRVATDDASEWEARKVRKDGSIMWVRERAVAVEDPERGRVLLVSCLDITRERSASLHKG